ncbi:Protein of unknown function (DUF952) [Teratosphaeria destructans]|uniref:DUF952 domain-containing protein n=1 Tax=Teratosphaeria destructans TaxID=418781 RepID=A0A9W7W307_9PEZI|nr:Protein of unknown function (DUF952) [Teratosphaeria destructans]
MPPPTYLYKILDSPPPSPLPPTLPPTALDTKDGFIHLSRAQQIPLTAERFFAAHETVWLLKLRTADLDGDIRYSTEAGAGGDVPEGCRAPPRQREGARRPQYRGGHVSVSD